MNATLSQSSVASNMLWVVKIIVLPFDFSDKIISFITLLFDGSRPLVGSSKNKISGLCNKAFIKFNRDFIPFEYSDTLLFASFSSPTDFNNSSIDSSFLEYRDPKYFKFSIAVNFSYKLGNSKSTPIFS